MADTPRYVISDIVVDRNGDWYSGNTKIINTRILTFFKKGLFYDVNGIFIYNEFGSKSEKAYIKVQGPVLRVTRIEGGHFLLDNNERVDIANKELAMDSAGKIYIVIDRLKAWAVFSKEAMNELGDRLTQKEKRFYWNNKPVREIKEIPWFFG